MWVLIVSQYDIYVKDPVLHATAPRGLQFVIRIILVESVGNNAENCEFFAVTQRVLIRLQIGAHEVKEYVKLHH